MNILIFVGIIIGYIIYDLIKKIIYNECKVYLKLKDSDSKLNFVALNKNSLSNMSFYEENNFILERYGLIVKILMELEYYNQ